MRLDREVDLERSRAGIKWAEDSGKYLASGREFIGRRYLPIYQGVAAGLTEAGLGPFIFEVSQDQTDPSKKGKLDENSAWLAVDFKGVPGRERLQRAVSEATEVQRRLESERRPKEEIEKIIGRVIGDVVELAVYRDEADNKFVFANSMAVSAHNQGMLGAAHYVPGEEWRTNGVFASARLLRDRSARMHDHVGTLVRKQHEIQKRIAEY